MLGLDQSEFIFRPKSQDAMVQVSCGGDHTVVLSRQQGQVWSWGRGTWGQTGHGHADLVSLPKLVQALGHQRFEQVASTSLSARCKHLENAEQA